MDSDTHDRPDAGYSLIEVVMTVMIMAVVAVPLMAAIMTSVKFSAQRTATAVVETVVANAADRVNRAPLACDYRQYLDAAALEQGWQTSAVTVSMKRYVPGSTPAVAGSWIAGACAGSTPDAGAVQLVTITVQSPGTGGRRTIEVVKSDV